MFIQHFIFKAFAEIKGNDSVFEIPEINMKVSETRWSEAWDGDIQIDDANS